MTSKKRYNELILEIKNKILELSNKIDNEKNDTPNWADVGTLGYIKSELETINEFYIQKL